MFQEGEIPIATYHFKHALVQDAAYSTLPKKPRRVLHARIAKALESRFAERVTLEPELLAYHYEQAGLAGPAVEYWHRAARRDAERSANIEALNHFNRALDLLKDLPQGPERNALELELLIARGAPLLSVKGYASDEMEHNYRRAKELSQENSGSVHQFRAIWGLWVFHLVRGQLAKARGLAENLLALATREQSSDLLIEAHRNLGTTYFYLGRFDEAKTHLLTAKSLYDPTQHRSHAVRYGQDPGITSRIYLARTLWILGEVEQVETLALEAIGMARELEHPFTWFLPYVSFPGSIPRFATRIERWSSPTKPLRFQHNTHLNWVWHGRRPLKAGPWPNRGKRTGSASYYTGFPRFGPQVQVSTPLIRWRCLQKSIYGTTALTKAWAQLRKRRSLPSLGENCFGKRSCFD